MGIIVTGKKKALGGGAKHYRKWSEWTSGDEIVGTLLEIGRDKTYGKPNYVFQIHQINFIEGNLDSKNNKIEVGEILVLNDSGLLASLIDKAGGVGSRLHIIYKGTEILPDDHKFKGKECHQFEVFELFDDADVSVHNSNTTGL